MSNSNYKDLTGLKVGMLRVIEKTEKRSSSGGIMWLCECSCGNRVLKRTTDLANGSSTDCGCLRKEKIGKAATTHGQSKTRLYNIYKNMKQRCTNSKNNNYPKYGGRGIYVCEEWLSSFEAFRDWSLANGYQENLTLDRVDNDGPYSPENCRWATRKEQQRNTRANVNITINGETNCIAGWSEKTGVPFYRIEDRLSRNWAEDKLFSEVKEPMKVKYNGNDITVSELAKIANIDRRTMYGRLRSGWSIEKILNTPTKVHHKKLSK